MKEHSGVLTVKKMARALNISRSRYYSWLNDPPGTHEKRDHELGAIIERIYGDNRGAYGSPRVQLDMIDEGIHCSRKRGCPYYEGKRAQGAAETQIQGHNGLRA